ncbi:MAG: chemotaxis response regulator protein-glutamate methylesterase [Desulfovibrionaceae bacterium]|nr:chemotaxis response regulator protein-glutamate methylesterase [Desulfovibrionaceae bacterium]
MIKVVVVDDSAFMRKAISTMLEKDPGIKVAATARNGEEGLEVIRKHDPDVVTMDIEMPRMDGLTALRRIMMEMPRPVLMISSLTTEGAEATLKAMELGAVDFIPKQLSMVSLEIVKIEKDLIAKVRSVAHRKLVFSRTPDRAEAKARPEAVVRPSGVQVRDVVAIGVSTGGPPAVQKVLSALPEDFPAGILIAQHMPRAFTGPFAKRLDGVCKIGVKEAESGERFKPGQAYVSPGGRHISICQRSSRLEVDVSDSPSDALYRPSANVLLKSLAQSLGRRSLGVIMTGMGSDGAEGAGELKKNGGRIIAQSDSTCVVYGMPRAVVEAGITDAVVDIEDMAGAIMDNLYV